MEDTQPSVNRYGKVPNPEMTAEVIRSWIRAKGVELSKGQVQNEAGELVLEINKSAMYATCDDGFLADKLTANYVRMMLSRVPEIREVGTVSVKADKEFDGFNVRLSIGTHHKRLPSKQQAMDNNCVRVAMREVRRFNPDLTTLPGEPLAAAVSVINQYREFAASMIKDGVDGEN